MKDQAMTWKRLAVVWLPAALFLAFNIAGLFWLSGKTMGRQAQVTGDVERLEEQVAQLERFRRQAAEERQAVEKLSADIALLNDKVFGSLEDRLTPILRDVGAANRRAGLRPGRFSYDGKELKKLGLFQLGIRFKVNGRYHQIVDLLNALRESPQLLVVDAIRLAGEKGTSSDELSVSVHVSTYLAQANEELFSALMKKAKDGGGPGR